MQQQAQLSNGFDTKLHEALLRVQNHNYNEDTRLVLEALESDSQEEEYDDPGEDDGTVSPSE
jgi:hypothetical protein